MSDKHDEKYYRLWEYTVKVATGLRDRGFPTDDLDCPLNDWIREVEELIYEDGAKDQRTDRVDVQAIDDAIELFELYKDPQFAIWGERDRRAFELGIMALRCMKGSLYE